MDILLWAIGGAFFINFSLLIIVWKGVNRVEDNLGKRIDKLDEKLTDVDRRLCRLEGAFSSQPGCLLRDERTLKKAE